MSRQPRMTKNANGIEVQAYDCGGYGAPISDTLASLLFIAAGAGVAAIATNESGDDANALRWVGGGIAAAGAPFLGGAIFGYNAASRCQAAMAKELIAAKDIQLFANMPAGWHVVGEVSGQSGDDLKRAALRLAADGVIIVDASYRITGAYSFTHDMKWTNTNIVSQRDMLGLAIKKGPPPGAHK